MRVAGIMSGTSLDGIDVAVVDITARNVRTVTHAVHKWPQATRTRILAVSNRDCHTAQISRLNFELPELYARAVRKTCERASIDIASLDLVGCHGQTVYHEGGGSRRNTLQLGDGTVLAERLGVPVVSNFRSRDIAAGGQGAPLVPFVDYLLLSSPRISRVALNIGGIANITVLPAGCAEPDVIAFDTGPGNMVIDQLVSIYTNGRRNYDRNGALGAAGVVDEVLLRRLLSNSYYRRKPPKSAGREQYGDELVQSMLVQDQSIRGRIATATALTAATIANAVRRFAPETQELIAAGGGVHNRTLMRMLAERLPGIRVTTTAEFGIHPDAKEAIAFAILAWRTWNHKPGNLPSATGARHGVRLGSITH